MAHSNGCNFRCNIDELGGVIQWPTHIGVILGAILVNQVGCLSGPLTQIGAILGVILVNCVGYLSGPLQWVRFWLQYG